MKRCAAIKQGRQRAVVFIDSRQVCSGNDNNGKCSRMICAIAAGGARSNDIVNAMMSTWCRRHVAKTEANRPNSVAPSRVRTKGQFSKDDGKTDGLLRRVVMVIGIRVMNKVYKGIFIVDDTLDQCLGSLIIRFQCGHSF